METCEFCGEEAKYKVTAKINNSVSYACSICLKKKEVEYNKEMDKLIKGNVGSIEKQFGLDLVNLAESTAPSFDEVVKIEAL
jgi:ribosome-binding protein aMBF1 (putative translation factor)